MVTPPPLPSENFWVNACQKMFLKYLQSFSDLCRFSINYLGCPPFHHDSASSIEAVTLFITGISWING